MAFIGFGKINRNIIPLILGCVFCLLNRLLNSYKGTKLFDNVILTNIFIALGDMFIIVPFLVYKIKTMKCEKKQNPNIIEEINNVEGLEKEETGVKKIEYIHEEKEDIQYVRGKAKYFDRNNFFCKL